MSSILKALKKLEEEKAARLSGQVEISRAILAEKGSRGRRRLLLPAIVGVLLLALLVMSAGVTFWRSRGSAPPPASQAKSPQQPVQAGQTAPKPQLPPPSTMTVPEKPTVAPPTTFAARRPTAVQLPPLPSLREQPPRSLPVQTPAAPAPRTLTVPAAAPQEPVETTAKPAPPPGSPQPHAVPTLRVSGIAWQKDSASRLAIVNGQPVGHGATVSGATVDEIFPDLVRFTFKGEKIEVSLGKSSKEN